MQCVFDTLSPRSLVQQQTETLNKVVAQLSQHDFQPIQKKGSLLCLRQTLKDSKANTFCQKQQTQMLVIIDKVGCSNDKSLRLSPRPKEKHTFWQVTHYSKCDSPLV